MTQTVTATYTGGVLRPATPLPLAEGETVQVTVTTPPPAPESIEDDAIRRIREAKTMDEWIAAAEAAARLEPDDAYDLRKALNENRRLSGDYRMLYPEE
jgi:predicted DNA-binding antitoxin AbrB/MazE fold protein